ncbi:DM13 domain-containing protein [Terrihabitans soli]|nr:DM13 domain-containing protein [Terrihabitans soli]
MRRLLRKFGIFILGVVVGIVIGLAAGLIVFPFVFAPPPAVEQRTEADKTRLASGLFIHADPSDAVHWGKGGVALFDGAVFLESDFEVGPGPAYHVYLSESSAEELRRADDKNALAQSGLRVDLGRLRAFQGSQRYALPPGEDASKYSSVTVWCQAFKVLITVADLKKP